MRKSSIALAVALTGTLTFLVWIFVSVRVDPCCAPVRDVLASPTQFYCSRPPDDTYTPPPWCFGG
jgi:hypothetical protein